MNALSVLLELPYIVSLDGRVIWGNWTAATQIHSIYRHHALCNETSSVAARGTRNKNYAAIMSPFKSVG